MKPVKCLSLTQPWALFSALGMKRFETRSWNTTYRGLLLIHAAKGFPKWAKEMCDIPYFQDAICEIYGPLGGWGNLPLGEILGVVRLVETYPADIISISSDLPPGEHRIYQRGIRISGREFGFGDYSQGRRAWRLEDAHALKTPIPASGALGLWEFDPTGHEELCQIIKEMSE